MVLFAMTPEKRAALERERKEKARKLQEQEDANGNEEYLIKAVENAKVVGGSEWRRSKLMLVGEGRAGKTRFLRALQGLSGPETESTIGIDTKTCKVNISGLQSEGAAWGSYDLKQKQAELAMAEVTAKLLRTALAQSKEGKTPPPPPPPALKRAADDETPIPQQMDQDLVMKLVKEGKASGDSIIFSAWDYGGQEVFYALHHLFLSRFGVYLICFNMEWLVEEAPEQQVKQCMSYLSFWLNSIAVHTRDDKGEYAPAIFVGTHKDKVYKLEQHEAISARLEKELGTNHIFWSAVQKHEQATVTSGRGQLWFFPVNNNLGARHDPAIKDIMDTIQRVVRREEYLKQVVPYSWFRICDRLQEKVSECAYLSMTDMLKLAKECGLPSQRVPFSSPEEDLIQETRSLLKFFNQLGLLMYHDEENLKDMIVLDAAEYLVKPATEIIRDQSMHNPNDQARKNPKWLKLLQDGVLDPSLLPLFWNKVPVAHYDMLVRLLVKYGLFVPLISNDGVTSGESTSSLPTGSLATGSITGNYTDNRYLVPSLLKPASTEDEHTLQLVPNGSTERPRCFLVHFAVDDHNTNQAMLERTKLIAGFLPNGLFGRVLGKCVAWTQSTSSFQPRIFRDKALLCWGDVLFTIEADGVNHCIVVEIHPAKINPRLVMQQMRKLVQEVIRESMPRLQFCILLEAPTDARGPGYLVNLDRLNKGAEALLTPEVLSQFRVWLPTQGIPESYDVFVSSLLKGDDATFSGRLFHCLSLSDNGFRPIEAFWDRECIVDGQPQAVDPGYALCCSLVVVPLITHNAIDLIQRDTKEGQDLLFEWTLALELSALGKVSIVGLIVDPSNSQTAVDVKAMVDKLPAETSLAITRVADFLASKNLHGSPDLPTRTPRSVCSALASSAIRAEDFLASRNERFEKLPTSFVNNLVTQYVQPAVKHKLKAEQAANLSSQHNAKVLQYHDIEWLEKVGGGIAGDVWRCRWHSTEVAVKVLKVQSGEKQKEFDKEVEVNSRLPFHERIVPMNGVVLEPKCIVLKYLPRLSIDDYVVAGDRLVAAADFPTALGLVVDASAGITHLHEEGVIHRDISCRNFLLDDHLRAYVCDFGLSQFLPKGKLFGVGEPGEMVPLRWMAPEAVTFRHFSHATDTYMFGMFMYEFFARVVPFRMELPGAPNPVLAKAIQSGQRPELPANWPMELQEIIRSCWGADPKTRPAMSKLNARLTAFWELAKTSKMALAPGFFAEEPAGKDGKPDSYASHYSSDNYAPPGADASADDGAEASVSNYGNISNYGDISGNYGDISSNYGNISSNYESVDKNAPLDLGFTDHYASSGSYASAAALGLESKEALIIEPKVPQKVIPSPKVAPSPKVTPAPKAIPSPPVFTCSVEALGNWLRGQGLDDMVASFMEHRVDGPLLSRLDTPDLALLGLNSLQCKRLQAKLPQTNNGGEDNLLQHITELKALVKQQHEMIQQLLSLHLVNTNNANTNSKLPAPQPSKPPAPAQYDTVPAKSPSKPPQPSKPPGPSPSNKPAPPQSKPAPAPPAVVSNYDLDPL